MFDAPEGQGKTEARGLLSGAGLDARSVVRLINRRKYHLLGVTALICALTSVRLATSADTVALSSVAGA